MSGLQAPLHHLRADGSPTLVRRQKRPAAASSTSRQDPSAGCAAACEKRPVSDAQMEEIVSGLERSMFAGGESEVQSALVGEKLMEALKAVESGGLHPVCQRFYRSFRDVESFQAELAELLRQVAVVVELQGARRAGPLVGLPRYQDGDGRRHRPLRVSGCAARARPASCGATRARPASALHIADPGLPRSSCRARAGTRAWSWEPRRRVGCRLHGPGDDQRVEPNAPGSPRSQSSPRPHRAT